MEQFYPDRMASPDTPSRAMLLTLIEKAQQNLDIDEEKEKQMGPHEEGQFDFEDYLESMKQMRQYGRPVRYFEHDARGWEASGRY